MNENQTSLLEQMANWKVILVVFLVTAAFILFIFPGRTNEIRADSGLANPILDARFSYTPDVAYSLMKALKSEGRQVYVVTTASEDLVFPLVYNLFLALCLIAVIRAAFPTSFQAKPGKPGGRKAVFNLNTLARLPLLVLACDYAENACLIVLMLSFPLRLNWLVRLASLFTSLKWSFGALCVFLIIFGSLVWGGRKLGFKA